MNTIDKQIADVLAKYGEPFGGNVWRVQGSAVIYHKTLERIAAQADIRFDPPQILRAERDEAVILVTGRMRGAPSGKPDGEAVERIEWSTGEALVGVNYRVSGRQPAYVYAMAEKRAKDRVILKLIELHGLVYSEEEADEFKAAGAASAAATPAAPAASAGEAAPAEGGDLEAKLKRRLDRAKTVEAVTKFMLAPETQESLAGLDRQARDEVRDHAKARLLALGWPLQKAA